ncbi:MAG: histidine--tRNA ligase [Chitinophagaceae bacterium]|nr:histidine--tRNA ligase [Chitinophagaceae bacterium]
MSKPSIPQGTRDFNAEIIRKRNFIFNSIKTVFELYGYEPLETPTMENLDTLMGKYGDEGDKLIFKILNNGLDHDSKKEKAKQDFEKVLAGKNVTTITERALRYDLTIPFARYVAMNHGKLTFPFKRYQIQPVWRADRPQRGRYREFYQCDADVVGSKSLINEVELINIYASVFRKLNIDVEIKINSRKILQALAEVVGDSEKMIHITTAIDKLDKIGLSKVKEELEERGLLKPQISIIENYLLIEGSNAEKLKQLNALFGDNKTGKEGISDIDYILDYQSHANVKIDFTLARGLNYYTGIIFEIKASYVQMGSIGGGGRYDDLTSLFGVPNIPGVGISFGVDRIYDVMEELKLFPDNIQTATKVLFFNLGEQESSKAFYILQQLRDMGIGGELFLENAKFDKQFKYAEKKGIPNVAILGSKELAEGKFLLKNLKSGQQITVDFDDLQPLIEKL